MKRQRIPVKTYSIRGNVILGFVFALLAVAAAGYYTYFNTQKLVVSVLELSDPNLKITKLRDVFSDLNEAETNLRVYALMKDDQFFNNYLHYINKVSLNIDTLKQITSESEDQHQKVNLIASLLKNRLKTVDDFVGFKRGSDTLSYTLRALERLRDTPYDTTRTKIYTRTSVTVSTFDTIQVGSTTDPEPREAQSRGFFSRLTGFFSGKEKKVEEAAAKVQKVLQETKVIRDTAMLVQTDTLLLARIRRVLAELREEESRTQKQLHEKELELLKNNSLIISKILDMTKELESLELGMMSQKTNEAREVARRSVLVISTLMLGSLFVILIFTFIIMRNVSRSNFYRDQLFLAKQRAEDLASVKEEFLANMSHEIRTPLNSIIGFTEQLAKTALTRTQTEQLNAVKFSSEHLLALVNDILDFSKIEQGKLKLEQIPFRINDVILETWQTFRLMAREKKIRLSYNIYTPDDLIVRGDTLRLKQILFNLVGNAVKFTETGEVKIVCKFPEKNDTQKDIVRLRFEVHDTGIGISTDKIATIFDGFTQADSSLTRKYGGTGLGLTISKRLVEMQQGFIEVASELGKGSLFAFELSLDKNVEPVQSSEPDADTIQADLFHGKRILLVDDDELNIKLTSLILNRWGIITHAACSGAEALALIISKDFDVILTDIHMPDMSGVEMTQRIRALENPAKASTPIIAITANIMKDDLQQYLKAGMDDYLLKPYREHELHYKLTEFLTLESLAELPAGVESPPSNAKEPFNIYELLRFTEGNQKALSAILHSFVSENRQNISAMQSFLEAADYKALANLAHKMLTSYGHVGATHISSNLRLIEQYDQLQDKSQIAYLVAQVVKDSEDLFPMIESKADELHAA